MLPAGQNAPWSREQTRIGEKEQESFSDSRVTEMGSGVQGGREVTPGAFYAALGDAIH